MCTLCGKPFSVGRAETEKEDGSNTSATHTGLVCPRLGEDTHQIDPVGIHPAQGPPAQISVVVFGICVHATGVVSRHTAKESNRQTWAQHKPLLG